MKSIISVIIVILLSGCRHEVEAPQSPLSARPAPESRPEDQRLVFTGRLIKLGDETRNIRLLWVGTFRDSSGKTEKFVIGNTEHPFLAALGFDDNKKIKDTTNFSNLPAFRLVGKKSRVANIPWQLESWEKIKKVDESLEELRRNPRLDIHKQLVDCGRESMSLLVKGCSDDNPKVRWACLAALSEMVRVTDRHVVSEIISRLKDDDGAVVKMAYKCLFNAPAKEAIPVLAQVLDADEKKWKKARVLLILGKVQDQRARSTLEHFLDTAKDDGLRNGCLQALARQKDEDAIQHFVRALKQGTRKEQYRALKQAEYIQVSQLIPVVGQYLSDESYPPDMSKSNMYVYRYCDLAVLALDRISPQKFFVRGNRFIRNVTKDELGQWRDWYNEKQGEEAGSALKNKEQATTRGKPE